MKILITSGCSFSDPSTGCTWPVHLSKSLIGYEEIHHGVGSQGNGLISRRIVFEVNRLLKQGVHPDDILVGIMWSGTDRHEIYNSEIVERMTRENIDCGWQENPIGFVSDTKNWLILNQNWDYKENVMYYKHLHDIVAGTILSLEHILRTQWFLKINDIKYFMTLYRDDVFEPLYVNNTECKYLYDQLDLTRFLPVTSEHGWLCTSSLPYPADCGDDHPTSAQHKLFVDEIIYPWLEAHNYI